MRKIFFGLSILAISAQLRAEIAVQRAPTSSPQEYQKYLSDKNRISFSKAFIHLASVTEIETPLLEKCLEELYLGAPAKETCLSAVKSLTAKPLNRPRREVLFSFLRKLESKKSPYRSLYKDLQEGLLRTHGNLAKTFGSQVPHFKKDPGPIATLEMNAWKKALVKHFPLEEVSLLINGKKVMQLKDWVAPQGAYQWSLISNSHEPIIRLGTFSQFASESLTNLKSLTSKDCLDAQRTKSPKFGLLRVEIFVDKKCIIQSGLETSTAMVGHLGSSKSLVKIENSSSRHWVWPIVALIGVGLASSMNGKQLSLQFPGNL